MLQTLSKMVYRSLDYRKFQWQCWQCIVHDLNKNKIIPATYISLVCITCTGYFRNSTPWLHTRYLYSYMLRIWCPNIIIYCKSYHKYPRYKCGSPFRMTNRHHIITNKRHRARAELRISEFYYISLLSCQKVIFVIHAIGTSHITP